MASAPESLEARAGALPVPYRRPGCVILARHGAPWTKMTCALLAGGATASPDLRLSVDRLAGVMRALVLDPRMHRSAHTEVRRLGKLPVALMGSSR
jgi:hypothetical protein